ncbi:hypothetical protein Tco_0835271 [Tanacetum coccineum]
MAIGDPSGSNNDSVNGLDGGNPLHMNPNDSTIVLTWNMNYVSADVYMGLVYSVDDATISSIKQGGSSLDDYYHRLNSLWRELDALTKLPICVCDANQELDNHNKLMKLMQFLIRLDDCYQSVRSCLLIRDPLPEVKDAYVIVSREESHRRIPESSSVTESKINATLFAAKSSNNFKRGNNNANNGYNDSNTRSYNNGNVNRGPNPNLSCKNCGMIGHTIERCYELIGYPPGFKKQSVGSQNSSYSSFTPEQIKKLLNLVNETSTGSVHANMADSGANQHLTVSTVGMSNIVDISNLKINVGHPNGTLATVSHVGNLQLTKNVVLYDVLVVPGYCVSLFSMNKMIKDSKLYVGFDEEKCYIQDLKKEITLRIGSESGGLYLFDLKSDKNIGNVNMVHAFNVSKSLWHSRLGHPADQVLVVLKNDLNLSKSIDVSAC